MKTSWYSLPFILAALVHGAMSMQRNYDGKGKGAPSLTGSNQAAPRRLTAPDVPRSRFDPRASPSAREQMMDDTRALSIGANRQHEPRVGMVRGPSQGMTEPSGSQRPQKPPPVKLSAAEMERHEKLKDGPNKTAVTINPKLTKSKELEWCWVDETDPNHMKFNYKAGYFIDRLVPAPKIKWLWVDDWKAGRGEWYPDEFYKDYWTKYPSGCPCKPGECPDEQDYDHLCPMSSDDEDEVHNHPMSDELSGNEDGVEGENEKKEGLL